MQQRNNACSETSSQEEITGPCSKVPTALAEDPGLVPSTLIRQLIAVYNSTKSMASGLRGHLNMHGTHKLMQAYTHK
ncbi:hypothetical protein ACRRTK_007229 [Alexandromys fortis]